MNSKAKRPGKTDEPGVDGFFRTISRSFTEAQLKASASIWLVFRAIATVSVALKERTERIEKTIDTLSKRLEEAERKSFVYRGVYQRATSYRVGEMVTFKGGLWSAAGAAAEGQSPATHPVLWQLAVKSGETQPSKG